MHVLRYYSEYMHEKIIRFKQALTVRLKEFYNKRL